VYNFDLADIPLLQRSFSDYERECDRCLERALARPAYDFVLKASHAFNMLDARGAISVTERTSYIARVRTMARKVAELYYSQLEVEPAEPEAAAGGAGQSGAAAQAAAPSKEWISPKDRGTRDFLLEIGVEEMPASACRAAIDLLPERVSGMFASEGIDMKPDDVKVLVSPRRIAVMMNNVAGEQAPREIAQRGPAYEAAFDADGNPTKACEGFARAKGITPAQLEVREESGRRFVYYVTRAESRSTAALLPDICLKVVRDMYFPKNMRWGYKDLRFSRPVRWLVALWGDTVIPFGIAGLTSGKTSKGHRWLGGTVQINKPRDYVEAMHKAGVIVDHEEREELIWSELERVAAEKSLEVVDPGGKLEEVLFLVERPTINEGTFAPQHLALPSEVLITAMQSHQRYFPLMDELGNLSNHFLYVSNGDPAWTKQITAGNQRVLQGRIEDAEFSFEKDKVMGLEAMAAQLGKIVFHVKAGTMRDKTDRLISLVNYLGAVTRVPGDARDRALEAARLAKADQVSVMVREFADLEGVMGEKYALMEGHHPEVARALREQFLPDAAGGVVPGTIPGALLATAEKVDNIVAAFACNEPPSGSKDPYGLRRAAAGMVAISAAHKLHYDVAKLVNEAYKGFEKFPKLVPRDDVVPEATAFILERLAKALTDDGIGRDIVDAVLPTSRDFLDLRARATALQKFRSGEAWEDLMTVYTRPANLAKKLPAGAAAASGEALGGLQPSLFQTEAERELMGEWWQTAGEAGIAVEKRDYTKALATLARLRPFVDKYFADVLVMADDEAVRINRLRQLAAIADSVKKIAFLEYVQG
jgi:tetrameric-type glycyl-tRNA synthetase beta subunit